jgi:hypothetical protein
MFIRRTRVHPLASLPTPVARRKFIKENVLLICVPRAHAAIREHLPPRAALVGRMREGGVSVQVADSSDAALQHYEARLRQAAAQLLAGGNAARAVELIHAEVEIVGRYDATLRRIERIERTEALAEWLDPEDLPVDAREAGPDYLMRLWDEVVVALSLPATGDPATMRRSLKQIAFLAEDYQASGLTRGADELSLLAMLLESQLSAPTQPKTE